MTRHRARARSFWHYWFPVLLYVALIFGVSSIGNLRPPGNLAASDKLAHIGEYGILGFLFMRALRGSEVVSRSSVALVLAILLGLGVGLCDEIFQSFVPGRVSSAADFAADGAGLLLSGVAFFLLESRLRSPWR